LLLIGKSGVIKKEEEIDVNEEENDDKVKKESVKDLAEESLEKRKSSRSGALAREELSRSGAAARRPNTPDDKVFIILCICFILLSIYQFIYLSIYVFNRHCLFICLMSMYIVYVIVLPSMCLYILVFVCLLIYLTY
jgi:hypothetical protein